MGKRSKQTRICTSETRIRPPAMAPRLAWVLPPGRKTPPCHPNLFRSSQADEAKGEMGAASQEPCGTKLMGLSLLFHAGARSGKPGGDVTHLRLSVRWTTVSLRLSSTPPAGRGRGRWRGLRGALHWPGWGLRCFGKSVLIIGNNIN